MKLTDFSFIYRESRQCFNHTTFWGGKGNIAFVGDSRIRGVFLAFVNEISLTEVTQGERHADIKYTYPEINAKIVSEFIY